MKISEVVAKYIELRDSKATMKAAYDEQVANVDKKLNLIEAKLLEYFDKTGVESCKTEAGTAFRSVRNSASIADKDAFMAFVKANEAWSMMIIRANAKTIDEYKAANDDALPPGLNWSVERVVNFRRT